MNLRKQSRRPASAGSTVRSPRMNIMTSVTEDQPLAPMETAAEEGAPLSSLHPLDMGLLETLNSRVHCRAPMQRVDPDETPLTRPVLVDAGTVVPAGVRPSPALVETYRCACGFTIDVPAVSTHALAS
jgi:hypothetical protein